MTFEHTLSVGAMTDNGDNVLPQVNRGISLYISEFNIGSEKISIASGMYFDNFSLSEHCGLVSRLPLVLLGGMPRHQQVQRGRRAPGM